MKKSIILYSNSDIREENIKLTFFKNLVIQHFSQYPKGELPTSFTLWFKTLVLLVNRGVLLSEYN